MRFIQTELRIDGHCASLRCYIPDAAPDAYYQSNRPAMIVFPGGGYAMTYGGEAEPIALAYAAKGFCAFVLDYSIRPAVFPQSLLEGLSAIRFAREHAKEYGIDPSRVYVCGFSAGGHLAASVGTLWSHECLNGKLEGERAQYRPNALVLSYPVINDLHHGSMENLFQPCPECLTPEMLDFLALEKRVSADTPPTFLWHNSDDSTVPVECSLVFALALHKHGVPFEMRIWEKGGHGTCLGNYVTKAIDPADVMECAPWVDESIQFLMKH